MAKTWKVEGYKTVSYFSNKKKAQVNGVSLYLSRDISGDGPDCTGREVKEVWLNEKATYRPELGDEVCIQYNERGYVDDVMSYGGL